MADIFSGNNLKLLYNTNTGNASPQGVGNTVINEIAAFPVLTISSSRTATETYDSEYTSSLLGEFNVGAIDIVVNYIPNDSTHMVLDSYATSGEEFQITLLYRQEETQSYAILNGVISSATVSGDVNSVITKIYQFETSEVVARVSDSVTLIPLYQGDYGVGSNGVDVPEITSSTIAGNSFIKVPASQTDNPLGADMLGIGLVDNANTCKLAISESGTLAIYAKNGTTAWSRILTATQIASQYVPNTTTVNGHALVGNVTVTKADVGLSTVTNDPQLKITSNLSDVANAQTARDNLSLYSKSEIDSAITTLQDNIDTRALKATTINGYSLANNITISKTDVGLSTVSDDPQLKIADNLSDLNDIATARTNLDVYSKDEVDNVDSTLQADINNRALKTTTINGYSLGNNITLNKGDIGLSNVSNDPQLKIASNLSDLTNVSLAKENLGIDIVVKSTGGYSFLYAPAGANRLFINDNNDWGYQTAVGGTIIPLGVTRGGTGAITSVAARTNLDVYSKSEVSNAYVAKTTTVNGYALSGNIAITKSDISLGNVTNDAQLKIASNLSDLNNPSTARNNLGLGSMAVQNANSVSITGGTATLSSLVLTTALPIISGGTGASTATAARDNLGLGTSSVLNIGTTASTVAAGDDSRLNTVAGKTGGQITSTIDVTGNVTARRRTAAEPSNGTALTGFPIESTHTIAGIDRAIASLVGNYTWGQTNAFGTLNVGLYSNTGSFVRGASYTFDGGGNATAPGTWTNGASDERVKTDIKPILNPKATMVKIRAATWKMNVKGRDGQFGIGVLANGLYDDYPEATINVGDKELEDGTIVNDVLTVQAGDSGVLAAVHHATILELMADIDRQQQEIDELKALVQSLLNK